MNKITFPIDPQKTKTLSTITQDEFESIYNSLSLFLKPLLKSEKYIKNFNSLTVLFKKHSLGANEAALTRALFEEKLKRDIQRIALIQYSHMKQTNDWGDLGEQRIMISYCRYFLNIPNDREVTQFDADNFNRQIEQLSAPYKNMKPEKLRQLDENIKCDIFYKKVDYSKEEPIYKMLDFLGSTKGLIAGQLGKYRSVIYGCAEIKEMEGYRVTSFGKEIARTPACVLSIAAVVGGKHIAMRTSSCETIFANKWRGLFTIPSFELFFTLMNKLEQIGLVFKIKAVLAYKVKNLQGINKKQKLFINEILEGLIWHELGHGIVINNLLTVEDSAFGEALGVLGANIISVQKEILADWAPLYKNIKGPLNHFCDIARKDKAKATRLLYVYFSDNWFLGEQQDQFDNHSDIMISLILKHVKPDSSINFDTLRSELRGKKNNLFNFVLNDYKRITKHLESKIKRSSFVIKSKKIKFKSLKEIYAKKVRKLEKTASSESLEFQVSLWAKILEDLPKLNPDLLAEINDYLKKENILFHSFIKKRLSTKETERSLREIMLEDIDRKGFVYNGQITHQTNLTELLKYFSSKGKISPRFQKKAPLQTDKDANYDRGSREYRF